LLASALLWIYVIATWRRHGVGVRPSDVGTCILLGIFGYAVFSSFYFEALRGLSASLTVLLLYKYPVLVAIGERLFLKRALPRQALVALPLVLLGTIALVGADAGGGEARFVAFGLASAATYAAYILVSAGRLSRIPAPFATATIMASAGLVLGLVHLRDPIRVMGAFVAGWPQLLGVVILATLLPMALFLAGLKRISGAEASILSTAEPLTGVLLAAFFLRERLAPAQVAGGIVVIAALIYLSAQRPNRGSSSRPTATSRRGDP